MRYLRRRRRSRAQMARTNRLKSSRHHDDPMRRTRRKRAAESRLCIHCPAIWHHPRKSLAKAQYALANRESRLKIRILMRAQAATGACGLANRRPTVSVPKRPRHSEKSLARQAKRNPELARAVAI